MSFQGVSESKEGPESLKGPETASTKYLLTSQLPKSYENQG